MACLGVITLALLSSSGCGQGEGGRCQVNSDCASGLICSNGPSGNGVCGHSPTAITDAATAALPDVSVASTDEVEPDVAGAAAADAGAGIDATAVVDGTVDVGP